MIRADDSENCRFRDRLYILPQAFLSYLAVPSMDEEFDRKDLRDALRITRDNCVEFVMKDNHKLGNNPENIKNWVKIAREEIEAF